VDITGPGSDTDPELMERLQRQVLDGATDDVLHTLVEQTEDPTNDVVAALLAQARREGEDTPHRTKGPGVLGATPEQPIGPFGRWHEPGEDPETDTNADQDGPHPSA